ncbi:hypothetical protein PS838_01623 [Pseudomonas fluorescens]|nr:hypothetical protein PS838_01623 [Pseudomonas fluorescens]
MISPRELVLCQYHYDPLDRLTSHALPDSPERQRYYCKSRLATEIQGAMRYSIFQHSDQLLAQQRSEGDAPDATLLATDQQRSVLQTLKAGHSPQSIGYSPYGYRPVENGLLSLLGFNGERPDPVTGHYLLGNGYRAFNPVLMRFNSPDSLSPFGKGGLNAYAYCGGEPVLVRDPTGRWGIRSVWKGLKNLVGKKPRKMKTPTAAAAHDTTALPNNTALSNMSAQPDAPLSSPRGYEDLSKAEFEFIDRETSNISKFYNKRIEWTTKTGWQNESDIIARTYKQALNGELKNISKSEAISSLYYDSIRYPFLRLEFRKLIPDRTLQANSKFIRDPFARRQNWIN